jgi:shikimate kinase
MARTTEGHLVLVGMMGSGKTTVGRIIAERLDRPLLDSDAMIEARHGRSVRQIFADDGEVAFRDIETEVLIDGLQSTAPAVIATGGGVVLREENRAALKQYAGRVVWLCANPDALVERVKHGGHRPAVDSDPQGVLRKMFADREALYREVADAIVRTDGRSVGEVVEAVLR